MQFAAVEQHLGELEVILGGRHEAAATGEVRLEGEAVLIGGFLEAVGAFGVEGGHAGAAVVGRIEESIVHAEGLEDAGTEEFVVGLAGEDFDDAGEGVGAGVAAVGPLAAGLEVEGGGGEAGDVGGESFALDHARGAGLGSEAAGHEAVGVGEEVADGEVAVGGDEVEIAGGTAGYGDFGVFEFGEEFRDGIIEAEFALFEHHHDGDAGDGLGHGGNAEDGVFLHGALGLDIHEAVGFEVDEASAAGDDGDGAGDFAGIDMALDGFVNAAEAVGGHAGVFGFGGGDAGGGERHGEGGKDQKGKQVDAWHGDLIR